MPGASLQPRRSARGPICLTSHGIVISRSESAIERARIRFEREHCLMLRGFLSPEFLELIQRVLAGLKFRPNVHAGFGRDLAPTSNNAAGAMVLMLNDPDLFRAIEAITGCGRLRILTGSVRRAVAGGKALSWHDDTGEHRRVAITINLSAKAYRGGLLQIRERSSGRIVEEIANTGPGDAILFRVSPALEHRNTEIVGAVPKTAFSGWFQSRAATNQANPNQAGPVRTKRRVSKRTAVTANTQVIVAPATVTRRDGEETILLNLVSGEVYRLNQSGAQIYALLKRTTTPGRVARKIAAEYGIDPDLVARDCIPLLADLADRDLIEIGV